MLKCSDRHPEKSLRSLLILGALWILCVETSSWNWIAEANNEETTTDIRIPLHDGNSMPRIGLGVALTGDKTYKAVRHALNLGYALVDTAAEESYGNEDQVGRAMNDYKGDNTIFVTTKLWDSDHGFYQTLSAFWKSNQQLHKFSNETFPLDLYLIHSPFGGRLLETWDALVWLQKQGYVKSIGVSNFGIEHLEVLRQAGRPMPVVNQIEMHPLVYQQRQELLEYCKEHKIVIQAFGSLMHGYSHFVLHPPEILARMVESYNNNGEQYAMYHDNAGETDHQSNEITVAHILLQWAIQHGFAIIPKSSKTHRITENVRFLQLSEKEACTDPDFVLSEQDMTLLDDWGDHIPYEHRNIYKRDWNWNPIDEAPVHAGKNGYWPEYEGIPSDLSQILEQYSNENADEDEYWEEYWRDGVYRDDEEDEEGDDDYYEEEEEEGLHLEL